MGNWPVIIGWAIALACTWVAVSSAARVIRHVAETRRRSGLWRLWNAPGWPVMPLAYGCASFAAFTALGVLPLLQGTLLAALPAVALGAVLTADIMKRKDGRLPAALAVAWSLVTRVPRAGFSRIWGDLRALAGRRRGEEPRRASPQAAPVSPAAPSPAPAQGPATAPREVPPLREDEALAPVPHPAEVATGLADAGVEVPEPYRILADWIAGQDPETDDDQSRFLHGVAAGEIAVAEAWQVHGENMVNVVGLDPAYGVAVFDMADSKAGGASDAILVDRRYHVIYGEIKQAIGNGLTLPHRARQWFGGDGTALQDGPSESAA